MLELPASSLEDWLSNLKPYQKGQIDILLRENEPLAVAQIWVSASGPDDIKGFGFGKKTTPFFDRLKTEFDKFVCGHKDYNEARKKLTAAGGVPHAVLISVISSSLAVTLGVLAGLLAPAVALLLYTASQLGINAYCAKAAAEDK